MAGRRVVIIGATGFFGPHVARAFVSAGDEVTAIVRPGRSHSPSVAAAMAQIRAAAGADCLIEADILDGVSRLGAHDVLVNLAAYGVAPDARDEELAHRVNTALPEALVEAAKSAGALFLHAGTSAEYAPFGGRRALRESDPLESVRLYGASKAQGSLRALTRARALGVSCAVLRLFNLYGEGEAAHRLIPSIAAKLMRGERAPLSPGLQLRDFIYAPDAARAFAAAAGALDRITLPVIANVCTGIATSVADMAALTADALGRPSALLGFGDFPMRPDDLAKVVGNPAEAARLFGWAASTPLRKGVARTVGAL